MSTQDPGSIIFFGDSLTDNGNLQALAAASLPPEIVAGFAGPTGAVSDGPTWASYTADLLGLTEDNRAYADAEALGSRSFVDLVEDNGLTGALLVPADDPVLATGIDFAAQIDAATAPGAADDLADNIAVVLIGGNDYLELTPTPANIAAALAAITTGTIDAAAELALAGTETVWVSELPAATFFPALEGPGSALAIATFEAHNDALAEGVAGLQAAGLDVRILHMESISTAIAHDPAGFGLVAPYDQTLTESDVTLTFDADAVAFYDSVHPSTATHGILGAFAAFEIDGGVVIEGSTDAQDIVMGSGAAEFLQGLGGNDELSGGGGDDVLIGGLGDDRLHGGAGGDIILGGSDADWVVGNDGEDILGGQAGSDRIAGRAGNDILIHDGTGADTLIGGDGADVFVFTPGGDAEGSVIRGGRGQDTLYLIDEDGTGIAPDLTGITIWGIEDIVVLSGPAATSGLADQPWFEIADLWGMI